MFRFVETSKEWKERGTGDVRFLRHKEDKKVRVLMRAERTLRVRANHPCKSFSFANVLLARFFTAKIAKVDRHVQSHGGAMQVGRISFDRRSVMAGTLSLI